MEEKANFIEGRGHLIEQPKPCKDCKKLWSMYESEIAFYKELIASKGYSMPIRCADCRKKKSESKMKKPIYLETVANLVFKIVPSRPQFWAIIHFNKRKME